MPEKRILVLGGTSYIGRAFCECLLRRNTGRLTLFNRGQTNATLFPLCEKIVCDRNDRSQCQEKLGGKYWDNIVDFTGFEDHHIRNILDYSKCNHYTYVSSSIVDLSFPQDPLFAIAKNKLWCECLIRKYVDLVLVVRPGFVCGENDYTCRFEEREGTWFWRNSDRPVFPMIRVEILANAMVQQVFDCHTGFIRAGYHVNR